MRARDKNCESFSAYNRWRKFGCKILKTVQATHLGYSDHSAVFTVRCTLVQSAVLRSHAVCLSVCNVGGLWSQRLEFFRNNFTNNS